MKEIKLEELPKSKEFMKQAKIADVLTKKTGLEHGFAFCKQEDEIIIDKMCTGKQCSVAVISEKCERYSNNFHTHPKQYGTNFSFEDDYNAIKKSFLNKYEKKHIHCIKGEKPQILCKKINKVNNAEEIRTIENLINIYNKKETFDNYSNVTNKIKSLTKPKEMIIRWKE